MWIYRFGYDLYKQLDVVYIHSWVWIVYIGGIGLYAELGVNCIQLDVVCIQLGVVCIHSWLCFVDMRSRE